MHEAIFRGEQNLDYSVIDEAIAYIEKGEKGRDELGKDIYQIIARDESFPVGFEVIAAMRYGLVEIRREAGTSPLPPFDEAAISKSGVLEKLRISKDKLDLLEKLSHEVVKLYSNEPVSNKVYDSKVPTPAPSRAKRDSRSFKQREGQVAKFMEEHIGDFKTDLEKQIAALVVFLPSLSADQLVNKVYVELANYERIPNKMPEARAKKIIKGTIITVQSLLKN